MPNGVEPLGTSHPQSTEPPSDDGEILKFIQAEGRIANLRQGASARVHAGEDPKLVEQDFQKQVFTVVQDAGLSPQSFQKYSELMQKDPDFVKRVNALVAEKNVARDTNAKEKGSPPTEDLAP